MSCGSCESQILGALFVTGETKVFQDDSNYENVTHIQRDIVTLEKKSTIEIMSQPLTLSE